MRNILFCLCLLFIFFVVSEASASKLDGDWKIKQQLCYDSTTETVTPTPTPAATPITPPPRRISPIFTSIIHWERIYHVSSNDTSCSKSSSTFTIKNNKMYSDNEEIGSVSQQGKNIDIEFDEEVLKSSFEEAFQQLGVNITIEEVEYLLKGKLKNKTIKGKIEGYITAIYQEKKATIELYGKFTAKKR